MSYRRLFQTDFDTVTGFYVAVLPQLQIRAYGLTPTEAESALEAEARRFLSNLGRLEEARTRLEQSAYQN